MIKCCRCDREVPEDEVKPDKYIPGSSCWVCRLKLEMLDAGHMCFGVNVDTGESFTCKSLWEEKTSKVLKEMDDVRARRALSGNAGKSQGSS